MRTSRFVTTAIFFGLFGTGCGGQSMVAPKDQPSDASDGGASGFISEPLKAATFHRDIRPLIEERCVGCHSKDNIAPFSLRYDPAEWADGTPSWAASAVHAVETRAMPPWIADTACHDMVGVRGLSDEEVALFSGWEANGFAQGDIADYVAPQIDQVELGKASLELAAAAAYTPSTKRPDDYRCFILPHTFDKTAYLTATTVLPDAKEQVHHVILFTLSAADIAAAEALDAAEEGLGYTCYGGPGVSNTETVGGWVPGTSPQVAPVDSARVLAPGSRLIMQVHYNTAHAGHGSGPVADRTLAKLWLLPEGQVPTYRVRSVPVANLGIYIDAGDPDSVQEMVTTTPLAGTLVGVLPHMHTRGKTIELTAMDAGDDCLVRIPQWDFHWQQGYRFTESSYLQLSQGDRIKLRCTYDNSGNTEDVKWGEGTGDEMCVAFLDIQTKLGGEGPTLAEECPTYDACVEACPHGDGTCLAGCTSASVSCATCTIPALAQCAAVGCISEGVAAQSCFSACDGDQSCQFTQCNSEVAAFFACAEPHLRDGSCDAALSTCGN